MFLVKSRDYYITDGNLFQIDVSFNSNDENYKKGYYIVISEVVIFKPNKKKNDMDFDVQVEKKYKESKMQLLSEQEEECEDVLSNCITMKESALNNIIDNSKTFARKPMILEDNTKANYSVDAIMTKPKTTLKILNELRETFVDLNNERYPSVNPPHFVLEFLIIVMMEFIECLLCTNEDKEVKGPI